MSYLTYKGFALEEASLAHSRITQLVLHDLPGGSQLYGVTRYDGVLQQWDLTSGTIRVGETISFDGDLQLGGAGALGEVYVDDRIALLTGGLAQGVLQTVSLGDDGAFTSQTALTALPENFAGLQHTTTIRLNDATQVTYGSFANDTGIGMLTLDADGQLQNSAIFGDAGALTATQISGTADITSGGMRYWLTIDAVQNSLTGWAIAPDGALSQSTSIGAEAGLWISTPTGLETVTLGGIGYAVAAGAGSDSLSVIEVRTDGTMIVRDHILDNLNTRFGGAAAIEIIQYADRAFVVAGGRDDGISVFALLEGGILVHRAHIADTDDITLDNVSAIAGFGADGALHLFVASSSEAGVTQLHYDTGEPGITATTTLTGGLLSGTSGRDILQGQDGDDTIIGDAGDDILRDGAGSDLLTGGAGRDLFLMSADGQADTITDFKLGEDKIDLSLWPMLRDISQLTMSIRSDGMQIAYGDEELIVQSADGGPIDYRDVPTEDLIGLTRIPSDLVSGSPGPATPADPFSGPEPAPDQGGPIEPIAPVLAVHQSNQDLLRDILGLQQGTDNGREVNGQATAEVLTGSPDRDLMFAGDGQDIARGASGNDILFGRGGNDMLFGDDGADTLFGGDGDDLLEGGFGDDVLHGGAGADSFVFNGGHDVIRDFVVGEDSIKLDPRLWTGLTSAEDLLFVYAETVTEGIAITFDTGDQLMIEDAYDIDILADDLLLF